MMVILMKDYEAKVRFEHDRCNCIKTIATGYFFLENTENGEKEKGCRSIPLIFLW
jgi:hypothetical protein